MTQDKARKSAIRQRMAATGERYSVARHAVRDDDGGAAGPELTRDEDVRDEGTEQARRLAEQARQLAEHARMRADEAATAAEEAADLTEEAAELAGEWDDDEESVSARHRADEARAAAERARRRAEHADDLA